MEPEVEPETVPKRKGTIEWPAGFSSDSFDSDDPTAPANSQPSVWNVPKAHPVQLSLKQRLSPGGVVDVKAKRHRGTLWPEACLWPEGTCPHPRASFCVCPCEPESGSEAEPDLGSATPASEEELAAMRKYGRNRSP